MTNHPDDDEQHPAAPPSPAPAHPAPPYPAPSHPTAQLLDPSVPPGVRQAAWRYGARQKSAGLAWGLWGGSFFILLIPVHGFYLGRILQSVLRGLMSIGAMVLFNVTYFAFFFAATSQFDEGTTGFPTPGPLTWVGFALAAALGLACLIWWIIDATRMGRRIEALNERIRQDVADEHGVAPWSF